jgi:hypothetical protein
MRTNLEANLGGVLRAVPQLLAEVAGRAAGPREALSWLVPLMAQDPTAVGAVPASWHAELLLLLTLTPTQATSPARAHLVRALQRECSVNVQ